jgi:hypothetical protein
MKIKIYMLALLVALAPTFVFADTPSDAIGALQMFQPTHVDFHDGTLKATQPQPQIPTYTGQDVVVPESMKQEGTKS